MSFRFAIQKKKGCPVHTHFLSKTEVSLKSLGPSVHWSIGPSSRSVIEKAILDHEVMLNKARQDGMVKNKFHKK